LVGVLKQTERYKGEVMSKINPRFHLFAAVAATTIGLALLSQPVSAQTPVFTDNFGNGSTINQTSTPGGTPTASSTSYDFVSSKAATSSISPGDLNTDLPSSSSCFVEGQAIFTSTPVVLSTTGDYIDYTIEFTDTLNLGTVANQILMGLFNSGGVDPYTNLENFGATNILGGGVAGWTGYSASIFPGSSTTSKIVNRSAQSPTVVGSQDLVGNDVASDTENNPRPTTLINGTANSLSLVLTNGSQYTEEFRITLTGSGQLTVTNFLYAGTGTSGPVVFTMGGVSNNVPSTSFDGLAFGWVEKNSQISTQDVSQIQVTDFIQVPEPSTWMLLLGGVAMMFGVVGRRRRS